MQKLFGTDGIRGVAGEFPLDAPTVREVGRSLVDHLTAQIGKAPRIVVGRDTRESGEWIEHAFLEGARAAGATCDSAAIITTPGVAFLARALPANAGVVFSASHNPYQDNGIKIFAPSGRKLDDATEQLIEADVYRFKNNNSHGTGAPTLETSDDKAQQHHAAVLRERYLEFLFRDVAKNLRLEGLTMVVDCANGAAFELAPALFERLGAKIITIGASPDGRNINLDAGSLHTEHLQRAVMAEAAQLGVAFDGDADRALFVDARGQLVDGDAALWVLAKRMAERGELEGNIVVATVMSNVGLEIALRSRGIEIVRTDVGDKHVLDELTRRGASLGGEQSGHIIFPRMSLAGDGLITAIELLRAAREQNLPLHRLTEGFERFPQVLTNVRVTKKIPFDEVEEVARCARETVATLGDRGRLLLRYSGTEPLARIMIEGPQNDEIVALAASLASVIREKLGAD